MATTTLTFRRAISPDERLVFNVLLICLNPDRDPATYQRWENGECTVILREAPSRLQKVTAHFDAETCTCIDLRQVTVEGMLSALWEQTKQIAPSVVHGLSTALEDVESDWETCKKCDTPLEGHYRYCLNCGKDQRVTPP